VNSAATFSATILPPASTSQSASTPIPRSVANRVISPTDPPATNTRVRVATPTSTCDPRVRARKLTSPPLPIAPAKSSRCTPFAGAWSSALWFATSPSIHDRTCTRPDHPSGSIVTSCPARCGSTTCTSRRSVSRVRRPSASNRTARVSSPRRRSSSCLYSSTVTRRRSNHGPSASLTSSRSQFGRLTRSSCSSAAPSTSLIAWSYSPAR
jgi:hypothetical protein